MPGAPWKGDIMGVRDLHLVKNTKLSRRIWVGGEKERLMGLRLILKEDPKKKSLRARKVHWSGNGMV